MEYTESFEERLKRIQTDLAINCAVSDEDYAWYQENKDGKSSDVVDKENVVVADELTAGGGKSQQHLQKNRKSELKRGPKKREGLYLVMPKVYLNKVRYEKYKFLLYNKVKFSDVLSDYFSRQIDKEFEECRKEIGL